MNLRITDIAQLTADAFGLSLADLLGHDKRADYAQARHVAWYVARKTGGYSFPAIAGAFNHRDHTTVIYGVRKVEKRLVEDPTLAALILSLAATCDYRAALQAQGKVDVLAIARRIARDPRGGAINASLIEVSALGVTVVDLWEIASAAEALIVDLAQCEIVAAHHDDDRLARIAALSDAIVDEINHIAGPPEAADTVQEGAKS